MKAVIIDDNSLIKADHLGIDKEDLYRVGLKTSTRETAEAAIDCLKKVSGDDGIIFINLDLKLGREYRQYLKGVEILTWLRVNRVVNHCVLYSFRPIDYIGSRKQQNLIIFAEGASFLQLPFNRRALDLESLAKKTVLTENLKSYLRASFRIGEFRHRDANWWAVKQLWDVHHLTITEDDRPEYPEPVRKELQILNSAVAAFLHEITVEGIGTYVDSEVAALEADRNSLAGSVIKLEGLRDEAAEEIETLRLLVEEAETYREVIREARLHSEGEDLQGLIRDETKLRDEIEQARGELNTKSKEIGPLEDEVRTKQRRFEERNLNIAIARGGMLSRLGGEESFSFPQSNILIIDDQIASGWKEMYGKMFQTPAQLHFDENLPEFESELDQYYTTSLSSKIRTLYNADEPCCVLLDLRLFDEDANSAQLKGASGERLLRMIRKDFPFVPVIVTTASNKIWTYECVESAGADAFWVKEGFDEYRTAGDSVVNYSLLIGLVNRALGKKYLTLRALARYTESLRNELGSHWSRSVTWLDNTATSCDVDLLLLTLLDACEAIRQYLRDFELTSRGYLSVREAFVLSGFVNKIAGVYELVHEVKAGKYLDSGTLMRNRGDMRIGGLKDLRNRFSHAQYNACDWNNVEDAINQALSYLETPFKHVESFLSITAATFYKVIQLEFSTGQRFDISVDSNKIRSNFRDSFLDVLELMPNTLRNGVRVFKIEGDGDLVWLHQSVQNQIRELVMSTIGKSPIVRFGPETNYALNVLTIRYDNASEETISIEPSRAATIEEYFERFKTDGSSVRLSWIDYQSRFDLNDDDLFQLVGRISISEQANSLEGTDEKSVYD